MTKKIYILILFFVVVVVFYLCFYRGFFVSEIHVTNVDNDKKTYIFINEGNVVQRTNLYVNVGNEYVVIGKIEKGNSLKFLELVDNFLLIDGFENNYYVDINDIDSCDNCYIEKDKRYEQYVLFNESIVTEEGAHFYDVEGNLVYILYNSYKFPIIIKDNDKYGVEFNNQLLYINYNDVEEVIESFNTSKRNINGVGVLNYHFFYNEDIVDEVNDCNQIICKSTRDFQDEINYLKENNIMSITVDELEWYIDGKINLPKSVLITIDDGWRMNQGIELLEKNKMYATVFLITSWWDDINFLDKYEYIEFHSHGEKLHDIGVCSGGQGGAIKCLDKKKLINDLKKSSSKLDGSKYFAYPFYEYNTYSIDVLKEAGYKMAFAGQGINKDNLVHVGDAKYEIARYIMYNYTTLNNLDNYFSKVS